MKRRLPPRLIAIAAGLAVTSAMVLVSAAPAAAAPSPPAPPDNLRVVQLEPEELTLAWDAVAGATEYKVAVIPLEPFDGYRRIDTDDPTVHLDDLTWDVPYKVTVRAFVPTAYPNWYSEPSTIVVTTPLPEGYFAPTEPTNVRIDRDSTGRFTFIRWDAAAGFGPLLYDLHMESTDQPDLTGMFGRTSGLSMDLRTSPLVGGWLQPGESVSLWITAIDQIRNEAASQRVTLTCCPL
jgi:hypothetical protein